MSFSHPVSFFTPSHLDTHQPLLAGKDGKDSRRRILCTTKATHETSNAFGSLNAKHALRPGRALPGRELKFRVVKFTGDRRLSTLNRDISSR